MTPERWGQIKILFRSALDRDPDQRMVFLDEACASDLDLRVEIESLLACDEQAKYFMEASPVNAAPQGMDGQADSLAGRPIGPYKIVRELGHGGMGAVYLAARADDQYQKQVAIKLVKRGMDTEALLRRFRTEQQILANLNHPNIARLIDGGTTEDGLSYFIMDYVAGLPIDAYCGTHELSTVERLKLFRTVCSAVQYAHQHYIVHRDLKPSNVLVTADGVPKLLDFGVAKLLNPERTGQTMASTLMGLRPMTPEYASPEQVRGEPVTPASDVFALGILLYELLTGQHPYRIQSRAPKEIERVICEEMPEKPSRVVRQAAGLSDTGSNPGPRRLAADLDNIVLMALRKEPERRYASVAAFSEDIGRHLEGRPIIARQDTLAYRTAKFIQRNKARVIEGALFVVVLFMLVGVVLYMAARRNQEMERAADSIAVLPFVNASADPSTEYLSDGITERIISDLSQLPRLRVIASDTMSRYKGREGDPQKVGREINVRAVLRGKVDPQGDILTIDTELVDTAQGARLWGQQYNRRLSDLPAVQEDISRKIFEKLQLKLVAGERRPWTQHAPPSPEVYQLYLKGRFFWNKGTAEGIRKGIDYFEQAIAKDPNYALAHVGLAEGYFYLNPTGFLAPQECFSRAKAAALRALAIDEQSGEAHNILGAIKTFYEWDLPGATREFQRAIVLNPGYALAHHWYGLNLFRRGQEEAALAEQKRALEIDPLSIRINSAGLASTLSRLGRYDQALEQCRKALEIDPNSFVAHSTLAGIYQQKGQYAEAIAEFQKALSLSGRHPPALAGLGHAYAVSGHKGEAQKILDELQKLSQQRYVEPYWIAAIYAGLGEKDQAFQWLDKAYERRSQAIVFLKWESMFRSLRSDPRFADLVRRVGMSP